jgi:PBP1b-binding outer membrane lipoprotein LpoB
MKKVLFIAVLVILASCSNETSTSSKDSVCTDSTCSDSINTDSLIKTSEARIDTMRTLLQDLKK